MVEILYKGKPVNIPSYLEELSTDQYIEFLKLSSIMSKGFITPADFRRKFLSRLLGMKADEYTIYKKDIVQELDAQLGKLDDFFVYEDLPDGKGRSVTPRLQTTRQMMKEYAGWVGPGNMLDGMTFGDFTDCLTVLTMVKTATDNGEDDDEVMKLYEELTRKMYRPMGDHVPDAAKMVPPPLLVFHAVYFFSAVWKQILNEPVNINGQDIAFSILFTGAAGGRAGVDDKTGWQGITFEVASSAVFGNIKDVNAAPFWDVLLYLYRCKFEQMHKKKH